MIFEQLKKETSLQHHETEKFNDASKILDHSITLEEYKQLLITNYGSYKGLESIIVAQKELLNNTQVASFASAKNTDRIVTDLKELGINPETIEVPAVNFTVSSKMHLIGFMYVIEGSMMGGMLISKNMLKCDSLEGIPVQKFFNRDVQDTLGYWKEFKAAVENETYSETEIAEAVAAANAAFTYFKEVHFYYKEKVA